MANSPENTLLSFASAESAGVDEIELDVRVTQDDVLVVLHDRTAARTAATATPHLQTPVEDLTYDELRCIDLGFGQLIPRLDDVLDATTVLLQVEVKAPASARRLAKLLRGRSEADQVRCLVTSFDSLSLREFMDEWSGLPRGTAFHVPDVDGNWRDTVNMLGVSTVLFPLANLERHVVDELHNAGYVVGASLIEGPGDVRRVVELDVDTSSSNAPEYARCLLNTNAEFKSRFRSSTRN